VAEARDGDRLTFLENRHMWRLLLARLHPDGGGDQELFLFAYAVREEMCDGGRFGRKLPHNDDERKAENSAEHFLRAWQGAMSCWALRNREALKNCRA
jgi:hypothetical protein